MIQNKNWHGSCGIFVRRREGFTLIELILVICLVSVLAVAAAERFLYYQERAEKAAMESVLAGVKMGLQIRMAEMFMTNQQVKASELESENPMRWLQEPPVTYAGEYATPVKSGYWYYAARDHELAYVPTSSSFLDTGQPGSKELRFRVVIRYESNAITGGRTPAGVGVVPVREFKWF